MKIFSITSLKQVIKSTSDKMYMYSHRAKEKHTEVRELKSKPKALRHFKVCPVSKIDETFISRLNLCVYTYSLQVTLSYSFILLMQQTIRSLFFRRISSGIFWAQDYQPQCIKDIKSLILLQTCISISCDKTPANHSKTFVFGSISFS